MAKKRKAPDAALHYATDEEGGKRETHGEIALADEDRVRPHRSSALAFAPEAKGLRALSLYCDSAVLPLLSLYCRLDV